MALLKGRLFAGALYAGLLLGGQGEQVPVTPQVPSGGMIARGVQYAQRPAKHVKLSGKTWQEQDTYGYAGIKYDLIAQHKVFAFANTSQEQVSVGSITSTNLVNVYKTDELVSTHYRLNTVTAQNQSVIGAISTSVTGQKSDKLFVVDVPEISFGDIQNTYQNQHVEGRITLLEPIEASAHYQQASINTLYTEQLQTTHGSINTTNHVINKAHISINGLISSQHQVCSGTITTNDDEMLQVLLALIMLDEIA